VSPEHPCYPLPLAEWHHPLVGDERALADLVFVAADHAFRCHTLQEKRCGCACLLRHPERLIDLADPQTVAILVCIHGEHGEHCPLIGSAELRTIGERSEHVRLGG